eukprot:TRINITY_DN9551_c0_g1_i1.p1 TRINITY_DN9551_c0_g1~~TRINITY_DN9551_c0_g1_i1.p1  ORF type:complete len:1063 (+),score=217.24 TRINITY_DN9551_c0_g1_i1:150-3338(+)
MGCGQSHPTPYVPRCCQNESEIDEVQGLAAVHIVGNEAIKDPCPYAVPSIDIDEAPLLPPVPRRDEAKGQGTSPRGERKGKARPVQRRLVAQKKCLAKKTKGENAVLSKLILDAPAPRKLTLNYPQLPDLAWPQEESRRLAEDDQVGRGFLLKRRARAGLAARMIGSTVAKAACWNSRFFELRAEELVYWITFEPVGSTKPPAGCFPLGEVDGVTIKSQDVCLHFVTEQVTGDKRHPRQQLVLRASSRKEAQQWGDAIKAAAAALLRARLPACWDVCAIFSDTVAHKKARMVSETPLPDAWRMAMQRLLDHCFVCKKTKDRQGKELPFRLEVSRVVGVQNFASWTKYTKAREITEAKLGSTSVSSDDLLNDPGLRDESQVLTATHDDPIIEAALGERSEPANEHWLFHGSSLAGVQGITSTDFRLDLAGTNRGTLYGKGVYLAECSSKADEYAEEDEDGICRMLLCRASLGRVLIDSAVKPNGPELRAQVLANYDSLCGDRLSAVGTYREFVLYNSGLVYPAFVIEYRRKNQMEFLSSVGALSNGPAPVISDGLDVILQAARLAESHQSQVVQYRVLMLLSAHLEYAVPVLTEILRDVRPHARRTAASMLGRMAAMRAAGTSVLPSRATSNPMNPNPLSSGPPAVPPPSETTYDLLVATAVPPLICSLDDECEMVRLCIVRALEDFKGGAAAAVPGLLRCLEDESVSVRLAAAEALEAIIVSRSEDFLEVATLVDMLAPHLDSSQSRIRMATATLLGHIGTQAIDVSSALLLRSLSDDCELVRAAAATSAGMLKLQYAEEFLPKLAECLHEDICEEAQMAAAAALKHFGEQASEASSGAAPALQALRAHLDSRNSALKRACLISIGSFGRHATESVEAVAACLKDHDVAVQVAAAYTLGALKEEAAAAVPMLTAALRDKEADVRVACLKALANMGASAQPAASGILRLTRDTQAVVWQTAFQTLSKLGVHAGECVAELDKIAADMRLYYSEPGYHEAAERARHHLAAKSSNASTASSETSCSYHRGNSESASLSESSRSSSMRRRRCSAPSVLQQRRLPSRG